MDPSSWSVLFVPKVHCPQADQLQSERAAPIPPSRQIEPTVPPRLGPGGPGMPSGLDRSASHRVPSSQISKSKPLDRANTTRAPVKNSPPHGTAMAKSQSGQGRTPPGASGPLGRQPTGSKKDQASTTRRRDKDKENEEVVRQLRAICSPGDPNQIYRNLTKIGQG